MAAVRGTLTGATALRKWAHRASYYRRYGLYHDDCLHEYPHIEEALRRLPSKLVYERDYRFIRAFHLSTLKIYLPKEEWVSYEENEEKGYYLQPYLEEVMAEIEEKKRWQS